MNSSSTAPYTETERREAVEWFVLIREESEPTAESLHSWLRWMEATKGNRLAFEAVEHAWQAAPASIARAMPSASDLAADEYDGDMPIQEWLAARQKEPGFSTPRAVPIRSRRLRWTLAAAASVVVVIASGLLLTSQWHGRTASESDEFVTKTGEQIQIKLKDGSQVWLGGKSRLVVAFTKESRVVRLEAGEAFFSVKKDRQRRFRVHTASGDITAVGTAFDVRSVADRVTVSVTEGVVSVASGTGAHTGPETQAASVRIGVGQQAVIDARQLDQAPKVTQNSIPGERARWREGSLVYRDEPLRDVVADVARYSDKPLEIADESVGDLHYSGVVNKSAIEEWAVALHESFPVKIEVNDGRLIIKSL